MAQGIMSVQYMKDAKDPQWRDDPEMKEWAAFMDRYYTDGNKTTAKRSGATASLGRSPRSFGSAATT